MPRVHSVLITQCLQRDFVDLVPKDRPLPNKLHVGPEEAERLLGVDPSQGPVAQLMAWARAQPADRLSILHVRDWHDPADPKQGDHLAAFGTHGVEVFDGVGEFTDWLLPDGARPSLPKTASGYSPDLRLPAGASPLGADEKDILSWLYRDSARVDLAPLSGGFSGCRVFRAESHDSFGHDQAPSVAKIGPRRAISSERAAFERVE